jgi:hypothetical protein
MGEGYSGPEPSMESILDTEGNGFAEKLSNARKAELEAKINQLTKPESEEEVPLTPDLAITKLIEAGTELAPEEIAYLRRYLGITPPAQD